MKPETWTAENNPRTELLMAAGIAVAGIALAVASRNFGGADAGNARAGFLLGVLLLCIGGAAVLVSGRQRIIVNPQARLITVEDVTRFGTKSRSIPFDDVTDVRVGYQGRKSSFVGFYYLSLTLRSGGSFALFAPGRAYPGATDRSTAEGWHRRLCEYLGRSEGGSVGRGLPATEGSGAAWRR